MGKQILLLLGQCIILAVCFFYVQRLYVTNILPDKTAKEIFQQTDCFVVSKKLEAKGRFIHLYRADFLISYNVDGIQYNRWVSGNGLDQSFSNDQFGQQKILSQFDVGSTYPCWYNPLDPKIAIIVLRHHWLSTSPLLVPAVIALIVFYYLVKNLFQLIEMASVTRRDIRKEKNENK